MTEYHDLKKASMVAWLHCQMPNCGFSCRQRGGGTARMKTHFMEYHSPMRMERRKKQERE